MGNYDKWKLQTPDEHVQEEEIKKCILCFEQMDLDEWNMNDELCHFCFNDSKK